MQQQIQAARAYRAASAYRSPREQEADVFRRVTGALRAAQKGTAMDQAKALANGDMYFNIHTDKNKGGEIRGQVEKGM